MFGIFRKSGSQTKPWLTVVTVSETGLVRKDNQDSVHVDDTARVYCVADGMGGGAEGAKASAIVCRRIKACVMATDDFMLRMESASRAIVEANATICSYARERGFRQMGSTIALLLFDEKEPAHAAVCHVGDSRVYRIRRGLATQLTRDHTVGNELGMMIDRSRMSEFKSRSNPLSHILTRAVGTANSVKPDWSRVDVQPGDRYLICSDGVHDVISDTRLSVLAGYGPAEKAKERLASEVVKCGAPDNYTFILIEVGEHP